MAVPVFPSMGTGPWMDDERKIVCDIIPIAIIKREITRLKRLHRNRSIEEAEIAERIKMCKGGHAPHDAACRVPEDVLHELEKLDEVLLDSARAGKRIIEEQLRAKNEQLRALQVREQPKRTRLKASNVDSGPTARCTERVYVDDIDNFAKVRRIRPAAVRRFLVGGFLRMSENDVQLALDDILSVPFHRNDWGGEINDLYTTNVRLSGKRTAAAFLLKGPGIGRKELTIADCGKRGDQIVRLFEAPADLFVVQYIGPVGDYVISDVASKIASLRALRRNRYFMIMDGQDTARVLHAYGKL